MKVTVKLKRITLTGNVVLWDKEDSGFKKYAGSVSFDNQNYMGFLTHDRKIELKRNFRDIGVYPVL